LNPLNPPRALFQTTDELIAFCEVLVWAFVVSVVMLVFGGLVFTMLYSVTFVQQPLKTMAPIDMAYTKMLNDIVLLMTGSITTLIGMRVAKKASEMIAAKVAPKLLEYSPSQTLQPNIQPQAQPVVNPATPDWNFMGYKNPELDESWVPPPPPTTPPDLLESDHEREQLAAARAGER
jgi:hypothetical protein